MYRLFLDDRPDPDGWNADGAEGAAANTGRSGAQATRGGGNNNNNVNYIQGTDIPQQVIVSDPDISGDHCSTLSDAIEVENFGWWLQNQRQWLLQQQRAETIQENEATGMIPVSGGGALPNFGPRIDAPPDIVPDVEEVVHESQRAAESEPAWYNSGPADIDCAPTNGSTILNSRAYRQEVAPPQSVQASEARASTRDDFIDNEVEESVAIDRNAKVGDEKEVEEGHSGQIQQQEHNRIDPPATRNSNSYSKEDFEAIFRALNGEDGPSPGRDKWDTQSITEGAEEPTRPQGPLQAHESRYPVAAEQLVSNVASLNDSSSSSSNIEPNFQDGSYTEEDIAAIYKALNTEGSVSGGYKLPAPHTSNVSLTLDSHSVPQQTDDIRPKYVSATIIKPTKRTELGLSLKTAEDGAIEIEKLATNGFLFVSGAPLEAGDQIICIKTSGGSLPCGSHVGGFNRNEILRLLRKLEGQLTIVAQHATGNPEQCCSMTSKPHPEFGTGIFFVSGTSEWKQLQVHSIPSNGLFANSLLHPNDQVLSINGVDCSDLDATVATDIVKSAPRFVKIVTQTTSANLMNAISSTADDPAAFLRSVPEERRSSLGNMFRR